MTKQQDIMGNGIVLKKDITVSKFHCRGGEGAGKRDEPVDRVRVYVHVHATQ